MNEIICPLCGKPNPPDRDVCQYCEAPLKSSGFIASPEDEDLFNQIPPPYGEGSESSDQPVQPPSASSLEEAIPDWLKQTEASFLEPSPSESDTPTHDQISEQIDSLLNVPAAPAEEEIPAVDDEWLASLLSEAGVGELAQEIQPEESQAGKSALEEEGVSEQFIAGLPEEELSLPLEPEKPDWLTNLEASSTIKLEGGIQPSEQGLKEVQFEEAAEEKGPEKVEIPAWVGRTSFGESPTLPKEPETPIEPAEIPGWLEALRPPEGEKVSPTAPVEDTSAADIVTAGPLVGLRGVISAHPSAIQARKPPTYSIKLRVTEEQRAQLEMMEELLAEEQKPKTLPSKRAISYRHILRLVVAVVLILPIIWTVIFRSERAQDPQPASIPSVVDFTQQIQKLPTGAPVLLAFDYEPGFSGELNGAISTLLSQLFAKSAYLTLVTTSPSGPALAESLIRTVSASGATGSATYTNYTDLGYIPGGTIGLLGLATSPRALFPYSLEGIDVWARAPLNTILSIADFSAVILITHDPETARSWIEQIGPVIQAVGRPLLMITSTQAEPLIRPYYEAVPSQVQGIVAGLAAGLSYAGMTGGQQASGLMDAFSAGITISILIILIGSIVSLVFMLRATNKKKEDQE